jgi:2-dehydro-3-deoxyphosphogluconate aldolase/(4S)-4-hydroxy-2-oxoglutarate aldolase
MILRALSEHRLLPVVVLPELAAATALATILVEEGLPAIEITCRTPAALPAIAALRAAFPAMLVGAGTVLGARLAREAVAAGAQFLLAPGFDPATIEVARSLGVPMIPGVLTPTEVMAASAAGLDLLKLFPAASLGGVEYLRALASVFPDRRFVPTGGVDQASLPAYLAEPNVACCAGSWLAPAEWLRAGRWDDIRGRVRAAVALAAAQPRRDAAGAA